MPPGREWHQTSTLEGKKDIEAFTKANEPPVFVEFGPPGYHVFIGFTQQFNNIPTTAAVNRVTLTGRITNNHTTRPPQYSFYSGAPIKRAWVGLNDLAGGPAGEGILRGAVRSGDGRVFHPERPARQQLPARQLDENMDNVFAFYDASIPATASGTYDLGDVPVFSWFSRLVVDDEAGPPPGCRARLDDDRRRQDSRVEDRRLAEPGELLLRREPDLPPAGPADGSRAPGADPVRHRAGPRSPRRRPLGELQRRDNPNVFRRVGGNPNARVDGFTFTGGDSGGAVFVNGNAHFFQVSNNRIVGNAGFYDGGIRSGHPNLVTTVDGADTYVSASNDGLVIRRNQVTQNGGLAGAGGGISMCAGSTSYAITDKFWISAVYSSGNGGGIGHLGASVGRQTAGGSTIDHNTIIFNQTFDQSTTPGGGGIFVGGSGPIAGAAGLAISPGTGTVTINANLIQGNLAGAGEGGGIRAEFVNGDDVASQPERAGPATTTCRPPGTGSTSTTTSSPTTWRGSPVAASRSRTWPRPTSSTTRSTGTTAPPRPEAPSRPATRTSRTRSRPASSPTSTPRPS